MSFVKFDYEIQLEALLTPSHYQKLYTLFKRQFSNAQTEEVFTTAFLPGYTQLSHSENTTELVVKEKNALCKRVLRTPLDTPSYFKLLKKYHNQSEKVLEWKKIRTFVPYAYQGKDFQLHLQDISYFAYMLKIKHIGTKHSLTDHALLMRHILLNLGCEPVQPYTLEEVLEKYNKEEVYFT